jgi:fucose permease
VGFVSAAFIVEALRARFGRSRTLMLANGFLVCGYIPIVCTPPFPVVVCCFLLLGLGMAINLALGNVFTGNLQNSTQMLGLMHGSYGLGGTVGPLVATAVVTSGGLVWSRFYVMTLGMAIFNAAFAGWSFWNYEKESLAHFVPLRAVRSTHPRRQSTELLANDENQPPVSQAMIKPTDQFSNMVKSFRSKIVLLGALFIFAYQGAEVSISGWVISFLLATRHGNPSSIGYVTSGFWGGITVGRFVLSHPAHKVGEKIFVYGVVVGAAAFQMLVWLVPNIVGDAVAVVSSPSRLLSCSIAEHPVCP